MPDRPALIFASETTAARLLCMRPNEFRALVDGGHLPRPCDLGGFKRWDVEELRRIARGDAAFGDEMTW